MITILQQIINERISFLKEQINHEKNKSEVNKTFQIQIDAIRSVEDDDIEKVESIILQRKALLKNSKDVHESYRLFTELHAAASLLNRNWIIKSFASERKNSYLEYISITAKCFALVSDKFHLI
jgi:hypothetical protein